MSFKNYKLKLAIPTLVVISQIAGAVTYTVRKHDTLSEVLHSYGIKNLYGKNGIVKATIKLNKHKIKDNGNFIKIGQIINLPIEEELMSKATDEAPAISTPIDQKEEVVAEVEKGPMSKRREPSDEYPYSHFEYAPRLAFLKLDSTNDVFLGGSNVTALSKFGVGIDLGWHVAYDDRFSFFGVGAFEYFSMYDDSKYVTNKSSIARFHAGIGGSYNYDPELKFNSKISMRTVSFVDVKSPTIINLESIPVPEVSVGVEKTVFAKKQLSGKVDLHVLAILPGSRGSYHSNMGAGFGLGTEVIHKNKGLFLNYDYRSQKIGDINNKEHILNFGFKFLGDNVL